MPKDSFQTSSDSLIAPAKAAFDITPNDIAELQEVTKAIYIGTGGDVVLRPQEGLADVTFRNLQSGAILDVRVSAVRATGTSATDIIGLV